MNDRDYGRRRPRATDWDDRDSKQAKYNDQSSTSYHPSSHHSNHQLSHQPGYQQQGYQQGYQQSNYGSANFQQSNYQQQGYQQQQGHQQGRDHNQRGQGPEKRDDPQKQPPSASVIFLGLPLEVDDHRFRIFLQDLGASIDSTDIIYDRTTGQSRGFGFAKFSSVEHARAFVEPNFPVVIWRERGMNGRGVYDGMKVRINYSAKNYKETKNEKSAVYMNDGTRDVGSTPGRMLLLRGLDPLSSEDTVYYNFSCVEGVDVKSGLERIMMARDKASKMSLGFCFLLFKDTEIASKVLGLAFNTAQYPTGFRISNNLIAFSYTHENSFIPIYAPSEYAFRLDSPSDLVYWDDSAYVGQWRPPIPVIKSITSAKKAISEDEEMDAFLSMLEEPDPVIPDPVPVVPAPFQKISIQLKKPAVNSAIVSNAPPSSSAAVSAAATTTSNTTASNAVNIKEDDKKKGNLIVSRKAAKDISKWNVKQQELKAPSESRSAPPPISVAPNTNTPAASGTGSIIDSFADEETRICVLCQRQFKTLPELEKHSKLSDLHKTNLSKPDVVQAAELRKVNLQKRKEPKYIDRSAARREAFNQPDHPDIQPKKKRVENPPPPPTEKPNINGISEDNIGSKMLEKMGWSKGTGLGMSQSGMLDPVKAAQFQSGAGLGASKGISVTDLADATDFKEAMRLKAKQRMSGM